MTRSHDPSETIDTDSDGIGDNLDTDDDNDNVADENDASRRTPVRAQILMVTASEIMPTRMTTTMCLTRMIPLDQRDRGF